MKFHFLYHASFEGPGSIASWIQKYHYRMTATHLWAGQSLPFFHDFDFLIVMGGPMNIYEERRYPWLRAEKKFIEKAIKNKKKVLGVCLGAQLLADVLGAKVVRNLRKEIGWFPLEWTAEAGRLPLFQKGPLCRMAFHWHGDTFQIPRGAIRLAKSKVCENQAFQYGEQVVGLQFHWESTPETVAQLVKHCRDEMIPSSSVQSERQVLNTRGYFNSTQAAMGRLLTGMGQVPR